MTSFDESIYKKISPVLEEWARYVQNLLETGIERDKLQRSGRLRQSVEFEIVQGGAGELPKLLLGFHDYGRILSMKETNHTKYPNLDTLEEYVRKYYFAKYGRKPRYQKVLRNRGYDAAVRDLTWALARSIRYPKKKKKRRLFYARTIYNRWGADSKDRIRTEIAQAISEEDILNLKKLAKQDIDLIL